MLLIGVFRGVWEVVRDGVPVEKGVIISEADALLVGKLPQEGAFSGSLRSSFAMLTVDVKKGWCNLDCFACAQHAAWEWLKTFSVDGCSGRFEPAAVFVNDWLILSFTLVKNEGDNNCITHGAFLFCPISLTNTSTWFRIVGSMATCLKKNSRRLRTDHSPATWQWQVQL